MSAEVTILNMVTRLDLPADRILKSAVDADLAEVTIVGFDAAGDFYFASNKASGPEVLWALQMAINKLLNNIGEGA